MTGWAAALAAFMLVLGGLRIGVRLLEPRLAFFPVPDLEATPASVGLEFEPLAATTGDGLRLRGWYVPPPAGAEPAWTLLVFHGNAENIGSGLPLVERAHAAGFGVALAEYRGYAGNPGSPSEEGIALDGEAFWRAILARPGIDPARVAVWGRSIGSSVAVRLAASGRGGALVLESPFRSARTLLRDAGAWFLSALLVFGRYRFDQESRIGEVRMPLLIVHGSSDEVVPFAHGRRLYEVARAPKVFVAIPGGGHNDLWARHAAEVWTAAETFLRKPPTP
ncbi:MAG TPA: alpha/beta hydrolase [Candidatus Polarisedimenticolia bacterium]|nr:alpha/beta hydrolase [Candidatus Polarisedimenticolia bacterium]